MWYTNYVIQELYQKEYRHMYPVILKSPMGHQQTGTSSEQIDSIPTRNYIMTRSQTESVTSPYQRFKRGEVAT